ncbi:hypothetical protein NIES267_22970 [Calothrix parasitica NIES-267]|uniref:Outer membrane protein beta-barrel domain-containing protein n=1 Tax=Calothrix parasitica NIES-267 TaxID=1973488 RepID=A0A1Z4LNN2_9CYAN|nr:hypothetical protein NIES267_22970 [Calothrix parasitica NIES-267]
MKFAISSVISLAVAFSAVIGISSSAVAGEASNLSINNKSQKVSQIFGSRESKRPGDNYVGLGTVIGGDTDFIDAAIISKVKVLNLDSSKSLSVRPSAVFSNGDLDVRIPATIDITRVNRDLGELNGRMTPFAGGGVAIDSDGDADLMLTAGMDVQLTPRITGTAAANVLFLGDTEFDATIGVGYNF